MRLPDTWTERLPFLESLEEDWEPVGRVPILAWLAFYLLFLYQLARGTGFLLMLDLVLIPIHEGGHLLFRFFGEFISVAGGTFLQLFVPAALAAYFVLRRQPQGTAFCGFIFFEQFLPISVYMADARAQELPLLSVGGGDDVIHDWNYLFGHLGVLDHDTQIAATVRAIGWIGMLAIVAWLAWRGLQAWREPSPKAGSGTAPQDS
ncbi:MAG: hypothetical protein WAM01_10455 [Candidatus Acidiferrales bacterium]